MKNSKLEKKLKQEIQAITPNVSEKIFSKINLVPKQQMSFFAKLKLLFQNKVLLTASYAALVFMVMLSGFFLFTNVTPSVYATIALDVNPSIELNVDKQNKVLSVIVNNEDANVLLQELQLKNVTLDDAVLQIMDSMVQFGYLDSTKNSVLVSVKGKDAKLEFVMKQRTKQLLMQAFSGSSIIGSIITQSLVEDELTKELIENYGISKGKARIIEKIIELDPRMTVQGLVQLSINDLNLLVQAKDLMLEEVEVTGKASDSVYLSVLDIQNIVLTHAELERSELLFIETEFEEDDGQLIYEVEFETISGEYEYKVNAVNGTILSFEQEEEDEAETPTNILSQEELLQIIFNHSGYTQEQLEELDIELEYDEPIYIYYVEAQTEGIEFEYEINAVSGVIISYHEENIEDDE
jgi:uncharacterized membrane protein YkoI